MAELQLTQADLAGIAGSGNAGRVTIKDLENFLGSIQEHPTEQASAIRTGVADAMRRSWTRPLATVGVSVCLDPVLQDRAKRDPKPGPALYALRALALALAEQPNAAARLIGGRAIRSESIDIGVAVEAQDGIMVPVIRNADKTSLADLTSRYSEARRSRAPPPAQRGDDLGRYRLGFELRHLRPRLGHTDSPARSDTCCSDSVPEKRRRSGTRKSSNSFPGRRRELTLSFDHRSLDGGGAGRLLKRITELLADPSKL